MQVRITVNDRTHYASTGEMHLPTTADYARDAAVVEDSRGERYYELIADEAPGGNHRTQRSCIVRVSTRELAMVVTELAYQQRLEFVHEMTWSALQELGQHVLAALAERSRH